MPEPYNKQLADLDARMRAREASAEAARHEQLADVETLGREIAALAEERKDDIATQQAEEVRLRAFHRRRALVLPVLACVVFVVLLVVAAGVGLWVRGTIDMRSEPVKQADAEAKARAVARDKADRVEASKYPWERIPQVALDDAAVFGTEFLRKLGYTLHGDLVYTHWTTTDAWGGAHKQYHFYAVIDPAWPPLRLTCGPWGYYELGPLTCAVNGER